MARLKILETTVKQLFGLSINQCCFPTCNQVLIDSENCILCEICHISAAEKGGLRYDEQLSDEYLRSLENLILMCPTHHTKIDSKGSEVKYTVEYLKRIKAEHEEKSKNSDKSEIDDKIIQDILEIYNQNVTQNNVNGPNINAQLGDVIINNGLSLTETKAIIDNTLAPLNEKIRLLEDSYFESLKKPENIVWMYDVKKSYCGADEDIRESDLFIHFIKEKLDNENISDKKAIAKIALEKLGKLTRNQLDLIATIFLTQRLRIISYTIHDGNIDNSLIVSQLKKSLLDYSRQFVSAVSPIDWDVIVALGLGTLRQMTTSNYVEALKSNYFGCFTKPIKKELIREIDRLNFAKVFVQQVLDDSNIFFNIQTVEDLQRSVKEMQLDEIHANNLVNLYQGSFDESAFIDFTKSEQILKTLEIGGKVSDFILNQVGVYIGITYLKFKGVSLDRDIWIK